MSKLALASTYRTAWMTLAPSVRWLVLSTLVLATLYLGVLASSGQCQGVRRCRRSGRSTRAAQRRLAPQAIFAAGANRLRRPRLLRRAWRQAAHTPAAAASPNAAAPPAGLPATRRGLPPAEPERPATRVTKGSGVLPNDHGQVWRGPI